jgi:hypothetical protein
MVSEHRYPDSAIPQQSKKAAQEERQASDSNQYICITRIEVVWSSAWNKSTITTSQQVDDRLMCSYQNHESAKRGKQNSVLNFHLGQEELIKKHISCPPYC